MDSETGKQPEYVPLTHTINAISSSACSTVHRECDCDCRVVPRLYRPLDVCMPEAEHPGVRGHAAQAPVVGRRN